MDKKLREDIQPEEATTEIPEELFDYMTESWVPDENGNHVPFYVIWDMRAVEKFLGVERDSDTRDEILDDLLGEYHWGWEDDYVICDNCYRAVYTQGYYREYEYLDNIGGVYCHDCIQNDVDCRRDYIDNIKNDSDCSNYILTDRQLEDEGWTKVETFDDYNGNNNVHDILSDYQQRYPTIDFLFSDEQYHSFSIWASEPLPEEPDEESEEEPEEGESDDNE